MPATGAVERPATRRTGYAQGTQSPCWAVPESGGTDPGGIMSSDPHSGASVPPGAPALEVGVVIAGLDVADAEDALRSLAGRLLDEAAVTVEFPEALRRREQDRKSVV